MVRVNASLIVALLHILRCHDAGRDDGADVAISTGGALVLYQHGSLTEIDERTCNGCDVCDGRLVELVPPAVLDDVVIRCAAIRHGVCTTHILESHTTNSGSDSVRRDCHSGTPAELGRDVDGGLVAVVHVVLTVTVRAHDSALPKKGTGLCTRRTATAASLRCTC